MTLAPPGPVFVGGTGRSGTTILGQLVGARSDMALVPIELRLQCDPGGLSDLAAGHVTPEQFEHKVLRRWFRRKANAQGPRGVHVITNRRRVVTALGRLTEALHALPEGDAERWVACGAFLDEVLRPWCDTHGATDWVEMTPPNAAVFHHLARMVPTARCVHAVRDGRDVAASVVRRTWGPDDLPSAIEWWGDRMVEILASVAASDPGRTMTIRLESLVGPRREDHLADLEEFLGRPRSPEVRAFFDAQLTRESARPGSWAGGLDREERARVDALYEVQRARVAEWGLAMPDGTDVAGGDA